MALGCVRCGGSLARHFLSPTGVGQGGPNESENSSEPRDCGTTVAEAIAADVDDWGSIWKCSECGD